VFPKAFRNPLDSAWLRELLLWCLPALLCGGILRILLLVHFPFAYVHPDSPDFLITANKYLLRHRLVLHGKKAFLGPFIFMLPMLVRIPTLLVAAWIQHFFGLIYIVLVGAIVRCWTTLWKCWIIPATVLAAINPAVLWYEHALISEFQYLWCVTALVLAGTAYALDRTRLRFALLLIILLVTAGSRPEGKLYVLFCLLLVPALHWGAWRKLALYGGITLAFCAMTWLSTRNTQAGLLLYATVLPLAPDTPKSAPDFGPHIAPLRQERLAKGVFVMPDFVREEKKITGVLRAYFAEKKAAGAPVKLNAGAFCQRLAVEAALNRPLLLPLIVVNKFALGIRSRSSGGFDKLWMQDYQSHSCTYKGWMLKLMPRLTGRDIHSKADLAAFLQRDFAPLDPDWFEGLQQGWFAASTGCRLPWPGRPRGVPGIPLFFVLGAAGMVAGIVRPGVMRKVHFAWILTLLFTGSVVMLTGVVNPRYRFVFEPFALFYIFVLADCIAAPFIRRPSTKTEP
jgi:hypothetical protein